MNFHNKVLLVGSLLICGGLALGQSRGGNWPTFGGDAQRSGWEGADAVITKDSVKNFQLLWKFKVESQPGGMRPVTPPLIQGRLISYRGFKELAYVASNSEIVYSIDADLGTKFWQRHLEYSTREPQVTTSSWRCPGGLTAMPTMPVPGRGGAAGRGAPAPAGQRGSAFIGGTPSVYAISSDGRLHRLNTSTGDDMTQPVSVIPANARATNLTMVDNVIYTVTSHSCNDAPNAVWAIDLSVDPLKVRSFELQEGNSFGSGDPVIGNDGTVYVRSGTGPGVPSNALLALTPRELQLKNHFFLRVPATRDSIDVSDLMNVASPVVFDYKGRELIVTPCLDNRLCLLDAAMPGGSDHATPLYRTPQLTPAAGSLTNLAERGVWGSLSSWQDADGTRWILAPVLGPMDSGLSVPTTNGAVTNGFIAAFKVQEESGTLRLTPVWVSRDLSFPMPPVTASGVVFALSAGEFTRQIRMTAGVAALEERPRGSTHATLYALDAATGRELYSSRNLVTVPAAFTGLTVTTGRVYFGGADGVLYAFGLPMVR